MKNVLTVTAILVGLGTFANAEGYGGGYSASDVDVVVEDDVIVRAAVTFRGGEIMSGTPQNDCSTFAYQDVPAATLAQLQGAGKCDMKVDGGTFYVVDGKQIDPNDIVFD